MLGSYALTWQKINYSWLNCINKLLLKLIALCRSFIATHADNNGTPHIAE